MKSKSLKTIEESIEYLTAISDAISYEQRVRRLNSEDIERGQEALVKAIQHFTAVRSNFKTIEKDLRKRYEEEQDKE